RHPRPVPEHRPHPHVDLSTRLREGYRGVEATTHDLAHVGVDRADIQTEPAESKPTKYPPAAQQLDRDGPPLASQPPSRNVDGSCFDLRPGHGPIDRPSPQSVHVRLRSLDCQDIEHVHGCAASVPWSHADSQLANCTPSESPT